MAYAQIASSRSNEAQKTCKGKSRALKPTVLCTSHQPGADPHSSIRPATTDGVSGHAVSAYDQQGARPQTASPSKKQLIRERVRQMQYAEASKRKMTTLTGEWVMMGAELQYKRLVRCL